MMKYINAFFVLLLGLLAEISLAGEYILTKGKIIGVANTNSNSESFTILIKGGGGVCANKTITFPITAASSEKIYDRAYSAAMTAYVAGKTVYVYDYSGSGCSNASYIRIQD